jgi:hypothetical protein
MMKPDFTDPYGTIPTNNHLNADLTALMDFSIAVALNEFPDGDNMPEEEDLNSF